jgi:hypothetical protein
MTLAKILGIDRPNHAHRKTKRKLVRVRNAQ